MSKHLFTTSRLSCRHWLETDLGSIYQIYSDEEGSRWVGDGSPITWEESERWMGVTLNNYSTRGYGMSTIVDQATGTIVGCCGLVHPDNQDLAEIKYALDKVHWGKGYASEVVPAMLSYGASACGLNKIIATVAEPNKASQRVLLKSGMSYSDQYKDEDGVTLVYEWSAHANEGNSS